MKTRILELLPSQILNLHDQWPWQVQLLPLLQCLQSVFERLHFAPAK